MTFRKNELIIRQGKVMCAIAFLCLLFVLVICFNSAWKICLPGLIIVVWTFLTPPSELCQQITINEHGISCVDRGKQLWSYEWFQIKEVKKYYNFARNPAVFLVLDEEAEGHSQYAAATSFELCKSARIALDLYYGKEVKRAERNRPL